MTLKPVTDETFHEEVREKVDPVLVMFTGSWCQPCKRFLPVVEEMAQTMKGDIEFLSADIEETSKTASELAIRTVPSLALFVDGMVREIVTGSQSKGDLRLWIQENV
jgi:thioredoxin-like negative regulator of GroEL